MQYRDLSNVLHLVRLLARSRTVSILCVVLLIAFSAWQKAHATCPTGFNTFYQITGGTCHTTFCGNAADSINAQVGVKKTSTAEIKNFFESLFPTGQTTNWPYCTWIGPTTTASGFTKYAVQNGTTTPCGNSDATIGFGDYCDPVVPPPEPTPQEQTQQNLETDCASKAGQSCGGQGLQPTGWSTEQLSYCQGSSGAQTDGTATGGGGCACNASSTTGMIAKPTASGQIVQYTGSYGGTTCNSMAEAEGDRTVPPIDTSAGNCSSGDGSVQVCAAAGAHNCGYVNGEAVCLGTVSVPGATALDSAVPSHTAADGTQTSLANAPASYKPQDSNGTPITPYMTYTAINPNTGTFQTFNVYSSTQVANSSNGGGVLGYSGIGPQPGQAPTGTAGNPGNTGTGTGTGTSGTGTGSDGDGTCEEGEGEPDCGQDSIGGGDDCEAPPSCTSDQNPIDCYLAKQEWTNACVHKTPTAAQGLEALQAGFGSPKGVALGDMLPVHETIDAATWTNSIAPGAGSCLADIPLNFSVFGQNFNADIPVSDICPFTQFMRAAILIAAMFAGFRIYMEGFA